MSLTGGMDMSSPDMSMGTSDMSMNSPGMDMSPPDVSMNTDMIPPDEDMIPPDEDMIPPDEDMIPPDEDMSTTTDAPMDVPAMDPIIKSSAETPTDYYAPEYIVLAVLYFLISLLYIVNSQIDVPTTMNDWLRANPDYINLSLATLYSFISIVYVVFFHLPQDTLGQSTVKLIGTIGILLVLVYVWTKILRRDLPSRIDIPSAAVIPPAPMPPKVV